MTPTSHLHRLQMLLLTIVLAAVLIVIVFETGVLPSPLVAQEGNAEFLVGTVMVLLTLLSIPLALGFVRNKAVERLMPVANDRDYYRTGIVRILLLGVPFLLNTALYFVFMKASFAYMSIILLLAFAFILPTKQRYNSERHKDEEDNGSNS